MSANSPQPTPAIKDWLEQATKQLLLAGIPSARLDAELILAHAFGNNRTYLHAHPDEILEDQTKSLADRSKSMRIKRTPLAYITGVKEFYGRDFIVTPDTLIPRPESETIIDILKTIAKPDMSLIDIGTGSGCLGITAKLEIPQLNVTLTDISETALKVAKSNADTYKVKATFLQSDLLGSFEGSVDIIIANLPYVDEKWERSPETDHEPINALFADNAGMSLMIKLIDQAPNHLCPDGYLLLEADPCQHNELIEIAKKKSLELTCKEGYIIALQLIT